MPFPGRREDFETDEAYQLWRTQELAHLSQLMVVMVQFNPELAKSTPSEALPTSIPSPRPASIHSLRDVTDDPTVSRRTSVASRYSLAIPTLNPEAIGDAIQDEDETPTGHHFTYIPPQPRKFYRRLMELCLEYDLRAMSSLPEDQEVSLGILSHRHLEIINECALRWRIPTPYRVTCFLDVIKYKYEREEVPLECIPEGLQMVSKTLQEVPAQLWMVEDVGHCCVSVFRCITYAYLPQAEYVTQVYGALFNIFLGLLYHAVEDLEHLTHDEIHPYLVILDQVRESGLIERYDVDVAARVSDLSDRVREIAAVHYNTKAQELVIQHTGVNRAMPLLLLTDWIEKQAKLLDKRFPEPLLGYHSYLFDISHSLTSSHQNIRLSVACP